MRHQEYMTRLQRRREISGDILLTVDNHHPSPTELQERLSDNWSATEVRHQLEEMIDCGVVEAGPDLRIRLTAESGERKSEDGS